MAHRPAKRLKPRRKIPVGFLGAKIHFVGEMVDLSESGVVVRTSQELKVGTMGRLGFDVDNETFRSVAIVRRKVPDVGLAFQFQHMTPHSRQLLHLFLMRLEANA